VDRSQDRDSEEEFELCGGGGEGTRWWGKTAFLEAAQKEGLLVGFVGEEGEEEGEDGEKNEDPLSPAPGFADGYE
jgi:hypothetical protein